MNYKNINTDEVISSECYNKLPYNKRNNWVECYDGVSHSYSHEDESDNSIFTSIATVVVVDELLSDSFDTSTNFDSPSRDFSFGGGDFGGGGANGDW